MRQPKKHQGLDELHGEGRVHLRKGVREPSGLVRAAFSSKCYSTAHFAVLGRLNRILLVVSPLIGRIVRFRPDFILSHTYFRHLEATISATASGPVEDQEVHSSEHCIRDFILARLLSRCYGFTANLPKHRTLRDR